MKQDNKVVLFYLFFRGESNILVSNEKYNGGNNESHRKCSEQNFIHFLNLNCRRRSSNRRLVYILCRRDFDWIPRLEVFVTAAAVNLDVENPCVADQGPKDKYHANNNPGDDGGRHSMCVGRRLRH